MKNCFSAVAAILLALTTSACSASNTVGFQCSLRDSKGAMSLHISADMDKGLFTGRSGDNSVIVKKPAALDTGSASDPVHSQFRFKVDANVGQMYLVVMPGGEAFITSWSGATTNGSGRCTVDKFKGL